MQEASSSIECVKTLEKQLNDTTTRCEKLTSEKQVPNISDSMRCKVLQCNNVLQKDITTCLDSVFCNS